MLGAYIGDRDECSRKLVARVEKTLKPLEKVVRLFGYLFDKVIFSQFYRRQLAKRCSWRPQWALAQSAR